MTISSPTTAGAATPPAYQSDLDALCALVERHDALRARYVAHGAEERGEARWEPDSHHMRYHASLARLGRAMCDFERKFGFVPELG